MMPTVITSPRLIHASFIRSEVWFDDGNAILIAGHVMFKVHRGQLQRHSEFFHNLFSLPQPEDQSLSDGCSWIELHDKPSDMFYFLKALYDGLYFESPYSNELPVLVAVLRVSTKYFVEHLRQLCLARLTFYWPATLAEWDQREAAAIDRDRCYHPWPTTGYPILAIHLAIELSIPSVLFAAMYDLSRFPLSKIQMGDLPSPLSNLSPNLDPGAYSNQPIRLSRELLCRTLKGREHTQRYLVSFLDRELQPSEKCENKSGEANTSKACRHSFHFIKLDTLRAVGGLLGPRGRDADPLFTLLQAAGMLTRTDFSNGRHPCELKMCHPCKVDFANAVARAREELWTLLPRWFGIGEVGEQ